ncbi:Hypothetical predicted protein [Pelobates cultripes]|uniref:Uncharacterized protein n=1 Tax=Pelobates cultripes TaxID=61616 RepID=A0AAD1WGZ9_PELCU|nr:Hypothetical predicted protein [Pelobates cultripes]
MKSCLMLATLASVPKSVPTKKPIFGDPSDSHEPPPYRGPFCSSAAQLYPDLKNLPPPPPLVVRLPDKQHSLDTPPESPVTALSSPPGTTIQSVPRTNQPVSSALHSMDYSLPAEAFLTSLKASTSHRYDLKARSGAKILPLRAQLGLPVLDACGLLNHVVN